MRFLAGFEPLMKTGLVPAPLIAMAVMRILDDFSKNHPRAMEAALADMWSELQPTIIEAVKKDPPAPKDIAAVVLAMYFGERGDWVRMQAKTKTAVLALGLPERLIDEVSRMVSDMMLSAKTAAEKTTGQKTP